MLSTSRVNVLKALLMIFGGCMSNVFTLGVLLKPNRFLMLVILAEMLTKEDNGCGNLVNVAHMVAVASFAAIENVDWKSTWRLQVSTPTTAEAQNSKFAF